MSNGFRTYMGLNGPPNCILMERCTPDRGFLEHPKGEGVMAYGYFEDYASVSGITSPFLF